MVPCPLPCLPLLALCPFKKLYDFLYTVYCQGLISESVNSKLISSMSAYYILVELNWHA